MNCTDVRTRLPLLPCGDLTADEAEQVRAHLADCPSCQREQATLARVRGLLDAVPAPAVVVDLPRLYRDAAERQARRWRRLAFASLATAAAVVVAVLLSRCEARLDGSQVVVRWGAVPPPEVPVPAPAPPPQPPAVAVAPPVSTAEIEQRLGLLSELVQALSNDIDARDERGQQEMNRLRAQMRSLQQQMTEQRLTADKDVVAFDAALFPDKPKGASP